MVLNLFFLQVIQNRFFTSLGQKQYNVNVTSLPARASIIDRDGKLLAFNKDSTAAFILPRVLDESDATKAFLQKHFPPAAKRLKNNPQAHFLYVKRRLTPDEMHLIQKHGTSDIKLLNEPSRYYPLEAIAPLIGTTDIDNKGLFGIELAYNKQLEGKPTTYDLEKDARSGQFYFKKETKVEGQDSRPLQLTIASDLQYLAYEELKQSVAQFNAKEAAMIIMDPESGDIIAMANYPSFNPNAMHDINLEKTKNKTVTQAYELGSVIKICTALAALEEKLVTPNELIDCKDSKTAVIEGRIINTWKAHGVIPFHEVISQSNNIGTAQVAMRLDKKLYDHYAKMGFGKKTALGLPGENKGFLNHPNNWSRQSVISLSYGYEVSANLLQMARLFSMIANDGYWIEPRILMNQPNKKQQKLYSDTTIWDIKNILQKTTQEGTARKAAIDGYTIMCKTGTANLLENGRYNPDKNIYTCAGIVQKGTYKRVIVAFVKEAAQKDLYASTVAAPLFEHIAEKILIHDKII